MSGEEKKKRTKISQTDIPSVGLTDALRVSAAVHENYAGGPTSPLNVAHAMGVTPSSSNFRTLTGAAIAYGLTDGGPNASQISITPLAKRIHAPLEEDDDLHARREAFMKPRVINEFLGKYNGHPIPKPEIAGNVLIEMGVPADRADEVFGNIISGATDLGLLLEMKGRQYGNLSPASTIGQAPAPSAEKALSGEGAGGSGIADVSAIQDIGVPPTTQTPAQGIAEPAAARNFVSKPQRVFLTHGKNKELIDPIKKLLAFGEMEPVVSVEKQSISQPVPKKVLSEMRGCDAAIIHVDKEQLLIDKDANEHVVLNPNVLIEIGAAMALYDDKFILLVKDGVKLPSNLQGLYEVRYHGETLDGDATIRLLEAINQLKAVKKQA